MGCNRDNGCKTIARETYPNLEETINSAFSTLQGDINNVVGELGGLYVPDDYLGAKVKERINEISSNFESSCSDISNEQSAIQNHISQMESEHEQHYQDWLNKKDEDKEEQ